jgi:hypothetical protein
MNLGENVYNFIRMKERYSHLGDMSAWATSLALGAADGDGEKS